VRVTEGESKRESERARERARDYEKRREGSKEGGRERKRKRKREEKMKTRGGWDGVSKSVALPVPALLAPIARPSSPSTRPSSPFHYKHNLFSLARSTTTRERGGRGREREHTTCLARSTTRADGSAELPGKALLATDISTSKPSSDSSRSSISTAL